MTIKKHVLSAKVDYLNSITKGNYRLDYAYGGVRLVKKANEYGAFDVVSERMSSPAMAATLDSIINVLQMR